MGGELTRQRVTRSLFPLVTRCFIAFSLAMEGDDGCGQE